MNKLVTQSAKVALAAGALTMALTGCCMFGSDKDCCEKQRCCGCCCQGGNCIPAKDGNRKTSGLNTSMTLGVGTDGIHAGADANAGSHGVSAGAQGSMH